VHEPAEAIAAIDVVAAVYRSHASRDTPSLLDVLADDVEWVQASGHPYAGVRPWRGHREVVEHVVDPVNGDWDGYVTEVDEMIDAGDRVVVTGRYSGTYRATGRTLAADMCVIYTVHDGRITRFQQYCDTAAFRAAMGLR
jgi:ketosteroid isomerase-like protein